MLTFDDLDVVFVAEIFPSEADMSRFISKDDEELYYPLDIPDMFDEDDEFEDEFADEFDELFEEVNYLYYDDDSEEVVRNDRTGRILH